MNHHLIVGILQHRPPAGPKPSFLTPGGQPIQQTFNILTSVGEHGLFAMQDFLVFCEQRIAQNQNPSAFAQQAKKLVRRASPGAQSRQ
jgi:hypothetical protein